MSDCQVCEEFYKHMEKDHHVPVRRKGESEEDCQKRFKEANPEAGDPLTCKCSACKLKREQKTEGTNNE